ncbi:hypothetical protein EDD63_10712 [Breznakia blatticola]|uniref:Uncharacterized protein n=1 Tax=Breznakia blatticola TaxID=1754012 RepID=A0A4R8A928_9FIRM|nr:hypothetical protein [Breznakia blatticola]TDW24860.1 hypothetical protein EDD63_10712 [Breznakia blatticola]
MKKLITVLLTTCMLCVCQSTPAEKEAKIFPNVLTIKGNNIVFDGTQTIDTLKELTPSTAYMYSGKIHKTDKTVTFDVMYDDGYSSIDITLSTPWLGDERSVGTEYQNALENGTIVSFTIDYRTHVVGADTFFYNGVDIRDIDEDLLAEWLDQEKPLQIDGSARAELKTDSGTVRFYIDSDSSTIDSIQFN